MAKYTPTRGHSPKLQNILSTRRTEKEKLFLIHCIILSQTDFVTLIQIPSTLRADPEKRYIIFCNDVIKRVHTQFNIYDINTIYAKRKRELKINGTEKESPTSGGNQATLKKRESREGEKGGLQQYAYINAIGGEEGWEGAAQCFVALTMKTTMIIIIMAIATPIIRRI